MSTASGASPCRLLLAPIVAITLQASTTTAAFTQPASNMPMALDDAVEAFVAICIRAERTDEDVLRAMWETGFTRASGQSSWTIYHGSLNASVAFPPEDDGAGCSMVFQSTEEPRVVQSAFEEAFADELGDDADAIEEAVTIYEIEGVPLIAMGPFEVAPGLFQVSLAGVVP